MQTNCVQYLKPHTVVLFRTVVCSFEKLVFIIAKYHFNFNDCVL